MDEDVTPIHGAYAQGVDGAHGIEFLFANLHAVIGPVARYWIRARDLSVVVQDHQIPAVQPVKNYPEVFLLDTCLFRNFGPFRGPAEPGEQTEDRLPDPVFLGARYRLTFAAPKNRKNSRERVGGGVVGNGGPIWEMDTGTYFGRCEANCVFVFMASFVAMIWTSGYQVSKATTCSSYRFKQ